MAAANARTDAYRENLAAIRAAIQQRIVTDFRALPSVRDADAAAFVERNAPVLDAGRKVTAGQTVAYLKQAAVDVGEDIDEGDAAEAGIKAIRGGKSSAEVLMRGITSVYNDLSNGKQYVDAVDNAANRLGAMVATDVQLAQTHTASEVVATNDNIIGYERVTGGNPCELCDEASEQTYHSEDLMPIHPGCSCTVEPIFLDSGREADLAGGTITSVESWGDYPAEQRDAMTRDMVDILGVDIDRGARNVLELVDRSEFSSEAFIEARRAWYRTEGALVDEASKATGTTLPVGRAVTAALSKRVTWVTDSGVHVNLDMARETMAAWTHNQRFTVTAADIKRLGLSIKEGTYALREVPGAARLREAGLPYLKALPEKDAAKLLAGVIKARSGYRPMNDSLEMALQVLRTQSPNALRGPKIRMFYNDFATGGRYSRGATIDAWMVKAITGIRNPPHIDKGGTGAAEAIRNIFPHHSERVDAILKNFTIARTERGKVGIYPGCNEAIIRAWRTYNARPGTRSMSLGDFQAWVWAASRESYKKGGTLYQAAIRLEENAKHFSEQVALSAEQWQARITDRLAHGGFTLQQVTGYEPHTGYAVAIPGHHTLMMPVSEYQALSPKQLQDRLAAWQRDEQAVFADKTINVGGWVQTVTIDGKPTPMIFFDPSEVIYDRGAAIAAGEARDELAIFDLLKLEPIATGGTGGV